MKRYLWIGVLIVVITTALITLSGGSGAQTVAPPNGTLRLVQ